MAALINASCAPSTIETACLLVSELATNAVMHTESDTFTVVVEIEEPTVRVGVQDADPSLPEQRAATSLATGGRGLALVDQLAARWTIEHREERAGKTIWFELACA